MESGTGSDTGGSTDVSTDVSTGSNTGSAANGAGEMGQAATGMNSQSSRRASRSRTKAAAKNSAVELENNMSEAEKTANGGANPAKAGKLELASKPEPPTETGLAVHESGELEVAESYSEAGVRPIEVSHLEVYGMILNNRPVSASHLQVVEYVGSRPIFASELVICDDLTLPGGRPIVASDPRLMDANLITGGRPIASNDIGDGELMMGYLD